MAVSAGDAPAEECMEQSITDCLANCCDTYRAQLREGWIAIVRSRGLLGHLSDTEIEREADLVLRVWHDFFTRERSEDALVQVRWTAERNVLVGRSLEETLNSFLAIREVCRDQLLSYSNGDVSKLRAVLPVFERVAQRLMVHVAASCADEREHLLRQRMHALVEAGMLLTAEQGIDRVLQKIVDLARGIVGARFAAMRVLEDVGTPARFFTSGMDTETSERIGAAPIGRGVLGVNLHEPLRIPDVAKHPAAFGFPPHHPMMHSFLGVPVASGGRVLGHLYVAEKHDGDTFSAEDEVLVATFASQAAVAIESAHSLENLRRLEESQRRERQHAELLQSVIAAQEEERKRVARELHDNTGQALTSLIIGLRRLESARSLHEAKSLTAEMRQNASQALDELHHLAFELRPKVLDDLGFVVALQRYAVDFSGRTGVRLEVQLDVPDRIRLEPAAETALYRIMQEALTNVAKHAEARTASVLLQHRDDSLLLIVEDDGKGFEVPAASENHGKHFGLMGMHERVGLLGGKVTIESAPGAGTTVFVEVPVGPLAG